ncbi:hypothetical protein F4781DRAFT_442117 [Annulohypoxylon bovei var. microspora]|nr:hypothetical protein F4781DRAFT_442117 [Annulohypoxylon bovei var. microspora]
MSNPSNSALPSSDPPQGALLFAYDNKSSEEASTAETSTTDQGESSDVSREAMSKGKEKAVLSGSDEESEESRLVHASRSFDTQVGPYRPHPHMPQSVRPGNYHYGSGVAFPRGQLVDTRRQNHESFSSTQSSAMTGYSGGYQSNDARVSGDDDSIQASREISNRIAMLTTFLGRSPGIPSDRSSQHTKILTEIGQLVTSAICNLRFERDNARRTADRQAQRAFRESAVARSDNRRLQEEVKRAINREKSFRRDLDLANIRIENMQCEIDVTEKEALNFQEHHKQVRKEMKQSEESQRLHIQSLEGEVKRLRISNAELAKAAGMEPEDDKVLRPDFSPPSVPESHKESATSESTEANRDFLWDMLKKKSDEQEGKKSKQDKKHEHDRANIGSSPANALIQSLKRPASTSFNPKAPSWQPSLSAKNLAKASDAAPARSQPGGPANWPALVLHGGTTPALGRSDLQPTTVIHAPEGDKKHVRAISGVARDKQDWNIDDVKQATARVAQLTRGYIVRCHKKGQTPRVANNMLSRREETTWKYVTNLVFTDNMFQAESHMTYLLSIESYRPFIIMRITLDYLYRKVIAPQIFLGFDEELDQHLAALQDRIMEFNQPGIMCNARERQLVLKDHARIINHALKNPKMAQFKTETITRHTQILTGILHPLRAASVAEKDAYASLRTLVTLGWDISAKVWTSSITLSYSFPPCGTKFAEGTMAAVNIDAFGTESPAELQFLQARVSFVVSPSLSVRDDREGAKSGIFGIGKAEIVAMK